MKFIVLLCIFISGSLCANSQPQSEYNIGSDVSDLNRKLFIERAEKGKILYKLHCSDCHGIFTKGKDSVPNFTKQQIDNYHARSIMAFKTHSKVRNLSYDQLDYVLTFLRLRKIEE